jgi:hypothetical protein
LLLFSVLLVASTMIGFSAAEAAEPPSSDNLRGEMSHAIGTLRNGRRGENEDGYPRFLLPPPLQMHTQNSGCEARPDELIPNLSSNWVAGFASHGCGSRFLLSRRCRDPLPRSR